MKYINYAGASETGKAESIVTATKVIIIGLFVLFGILAIFNRENWVGNFRPFFPKGMEGVFAAMGLTFIAFEGYEIIAQCGEEVKNPKKNIPRAIFISLLIVVPLYILVAFVALGAIIPDLPNMTTWQYLGKHGELAMVEAARQFMPLGAILLLIGGLFSTMSALNATIYSSSRVSFAMGRDHNLPSVFGKISDKKRTPHLALFISSILIIFMAVALPIEHVASAADIMFLLLFLQVNLAVISLRKKRPDLDRGFIIPLFPLIPIIGIISNLGLAIYMFNYSPIAWYATLAWIIFGILIYYSYSSKKEMEIKKEKEIIHASPFSLSEKKYRILVPLANIANVDCLMKIATAIAKQKNGEVIALSVVPIPYQLPVSFGKKFVEQKRPLMEKAIRFGKQEDYKVHTIIRIGHDIPNAIIDTAKENKCNIVILGWTGRIRAHDKILGSIVDPVVQNAPCDVAVVKLRGIFEAKKILIAIGGGPHIVLATEIASALSAVFNSSITAISVATSPKREELVKQFLSNTINASMVNLEKVKIEQKVILHKNIIEGILEEAREYDLLLIGASKEWGLKQFAFGSIPDKVADRSRGNVIMTRKYEGKIKKFLLGVFKSYKSER